MSERLRLVVFTAGPLSDINRVFYENLARDPRLDLRAIVVDGHARRRRPLLARLARGLQEEGAGWLWFKIVTTAQALGSRVARALFARLHPPVREESYEAFTRATGVAVHGVADIHADESLALIRGLQPQLGVIVGGRILADVVTSIPEHGSLNIHKRRVPDYRGGGPIGYWEVLAGEASIGVTIHYATAKVDAGDVMAEASIPIEECDTLASLRIKADLEGARLYLEAVRRVARGERQGRPQPAGGHTYRAPSEYRVWRLEQALRRRAKERMPLLRDQPGVFTQTRVLLQYGLVLPWLRTVRARLGRQRRSPVCILYYHLVANRPLNHMCLPLEQFVAQMEILRRHCRLVSVDEAAARRPGPDADEVTVAVTFDDGYRDNTWAVEYMRCFGVPAAFFVSIGHVRDGRPFDHDVRRGFTEALPIDVAGVRKLAADGFVVGSHGLYHEDLGALDPREAERVMAESRRLIAEATGASPEHFSFPKGQRGTNITAESFAAATRHYGYVHSAYGGYNFPDPQVRHLRRMGNPIHVFDLVPLLDGYTGLRECLTGNAWGLETAALAPYATPARRGGLGALRFGGVSFRSSR